MLFNHNILCLSNTHWDSHLSTMQQTMMRLAKYNKVLYINRPITLLGPLSGYEEISGWRQIAESKKPPRERLQNLFVATPPVVAPLRFTKLSERINYHLIIRWLRKTMAALDMQPSIIWSYLPESSMILENLEKRLSVYHCVDDFCAWGLWWNNDELIRAREIELLNKVDLVFTTSSNLQKKQAAINRNCYFIPNGSEYELFSKAAREETPLPPDIINIKKPIIGYIGMFNADRLDLEWLEHAAKFSDYSFVFIGKRQGGAFDLTRLKKLKNIYFLGFKEQADLPGYLRAIDVCIMPSSNSLNNMSVFPLKIFEYMAAGKPIVARQINELSRYRKYISLVNTKEDFLKAIDMELCKNNKQKVAERMSFSKENTWDARVEEMSNIIENTIIR
jgi:glycosyltransferase involved in cell wall biosynthesis